MKLDKLYELRRSFTLIGLTGRTGSGCSKIAEILSDNFEKLKENGLRDINDINDPIDRQKYRICYNYLSYGNNWEPFTTIKYKNVLLFFILSYNTKEDFFLNLLSEFYRETKTEDNSRIIKVVAKRIDELLKKHPVVKKIEDYNGDFSNIKTKDDLNNLYQSFFSSDFKEFSKKLFEILENYGYHRRSKLLHHIGCNIRQSGNPINDKNISDIKYIYTISNLINRLIKAYKQFQDSDNKPTKIVIDSLRNSLEIMFFKERYSGFYMLASKDDKNRIKERIFDRIEKKGIKENNLEIIEQTLKLDATEYKTGDYSKGIFSSPDVYNCIQKSDIHILNLKKENVTKQTTEAFFTREEQILKIISLIQQPGIVTPSSSERCMQVAVNSKLNSGCISRQVGAVVTDENYSVKSIGWNDVPSGQTPCNLRNVNDVINNENNMHYSNFEFGNEINKVDVDFKYKNKEPYKFPNAVKKYFEGHKTDTENLNGKNCSFCFKTIHNHFEGEKNQVHTRSLHAEENAMLQISKYGGQGLKGGILFTTASPCELCSKKASQLGIEKVYYIDPYPGISEPQILSNNRHKKMQLNQFNGIIGKSYHKLYEPFMAYKDEVTIMLDRKDIKKTKWEIIIDEIKDDTLRNKMKEVLNSDKEIDENKLNEIIK
jgi:deoxycytidylate deaminase